MSTTRPASARSSSFSSGTFAGGCPPAFTQPRRFQVGIHWVRALTTNRESPRSAADTPAAHYAGMPTPQTAQPPDYWLAGIPPAAQQVSDTYQAQPAGPNGLQSAVPSVAATITLTYSISAA